VQHDRFNQSRINTIVVVAVTSNPKYGFLPGNVRLKKHEAGLPKPSVVNVTQIATVDRVHIGSKIGQLSTNRLLEVWNGIQLVLEPTPAPFSERS
jgi:mRNA interferase MazF